ncbi:MAG: ADOP family duplicated permease [Acidobacteriota bacterium]|nr:ADOP family duplicated permease [Acidobacteriota bacterium]
MISFLRDLRIAVRTLSRSSGFTFLAVGILALGIGAGVSIFSVVDAVLVKALPYPAPERLVRVGSLHRLKNAIGIGASYADYLDWRTRSRSFERLGGFVTGPAIVTVRGAATRTDAAWAAPDALAALGIRPIAGRLFTEEEDRAGGRLHVALISEDLRASSFGSQPLSRGLTLVVEGTTYEVVGVIPKEPLLLENARVVLPLYNVWYENRSGRAIDVVGVLKRRATIQRARAEMGEVARSLEREYPEADRGFGIAVVGLRESLFGDLAPVLRVLSGAVLLLLLIACANVANLLLARGSARRRELAVRAALGASAGRLARHLFAETLAIALAGAGAGVVVAEGLLSLVRSLAEESSPRIAAAAIDARALGFAAGAALCTAVLFGLVPALSGARRAIFEGIGASGRSPSGGRERSRALDALVLVQTALCLMLLVGAGLLGGSYLRLSRTETGIASENVLSLSVAVSAGGQGDAGSQARFFRRAIERVKSLPGVRQAAAASTLPGEGSMTLSFWPEGHPRLSRAQSPQAEIRGISPGFPETIGMPILAGRGFTEADREDSAPVIAVNRAFAAHYWPGADPIGKRIMTFSDRRERTVVGVVGDVRRLDRGGAAAEGMFLPLAQDASLPRRGVNLVLRTAGNAAAGAAEVERAIHELDPAVAVWGARTMRDVLSRAVAKPRFRTVLVGLFAASALLLACAGLYGVISYGVARRRYEIGVRIALGATPSGVLRIFLARGFRLAAAGVVVGSLGALAAGRLLSGLLYGVHPADPATYAGAAALLLVVSFAASLVPAMRAAGTDPLTALRSE